MTASQKLVAASPAYFFAGCVTPLNKKGEPFSPAPNILQLRISEAYETCQYLGIPCHILVLKPRQTGISTFCGALVLFHLLRYSCRCVCMADDYGNSRNVKSIFLRHCDTNTHNQGISHTSSRDEIHFSNGSLYEMDTAQNPKAGISATRQAGHFSEVAKFPSDGVRDSYITMSNMLASINQEGANSLIICETTPEGAAGWFYDQWQGASSLDLFLSGKKGNGYIKLFAAWYEFDEHKIVVTQAQSQAILDSLSPHEKKLVEHEKLSIEQIAWRRHTKQLVCGGDERLFQMQYPEDSDTCFASAGRPCFDTVGIAALLDMARVNSFTQYGNFSQNGKSLAFTQCAEAQASIEIYEPPKEGCSYLLAVDNAEGAQMTRGGDTDCHSALLLRREYIESETQKRVPLRIVARLRPPCRLNTDVLATLCHNLSRHYGNCIIVVERNKGESLLNYLSDKDANIFHEDEIDLFTSKATRIAGWRTTEESRRTAIDRLTPLVRETTAASPRLVVDEHTAREMQTFMVNRRGKPQAMSGKHDDDVMALAIGNVTIEAATTYYAPRRSRQIQGDYHWMR